MPSTDPPPAAVTDLRTQVMTPGHCGFCGQPAEQAPSGRWWHLQPTDHPMYAIVRGGQIPAGPLGLAATWPPRFIAGDPAPHITRMINQENP